MIKNVGTLDQIARIVLGIAIIIGGIYFESWFGLIGIIPLATGLVSRCPLYMTCGLSTCKVEPKADQK